MMIPWNTTKDIAEVTVLLLLLPGNAILVVTTRQGQERRRRLRVFLVKATLGELLTFVAIAANGGVKTSAFGPEGEAFILGELGVGFQIGSDLEGVILRLVKVAALGGKAAFRKGEVSFQGGLGIL